MAKKISVIVLILFIFQLANSTVYKTLEQANIKFFRHVSRADSIAKQDVYGYIYHVVGYITAADINRDGKDDLIFTEASRYPYTTALIGDDRRQYIRIFLGRDSFPNYMDFNEADITIWDSLWVGGFQMADGVIKDPCYGNLLVCNLTYYSPIFEWDHDTVYTPFGPYTRGPLPKTCFIPLDSLSRGTSYKLDSIMIGFFYDDSFWIRASYSFNICVSDSLLFMNILKNDTVFSFNKCILTLNGISDSIEFDSNIVYYVYDTEFISMAYLGASDINSDGKKELLILNVGGAMNNGVCFINASYDSFWGVSWDSILHSSVNKIYIVWGKEWSDSDKVNIYHSSRSYNLYWTDYNSIICPDEEVDLDSDGINEIVIASVAPSGYYIHDRDLFYHHWDKSKIYIIFGDYDMDTMVAESLKYAADFVIEGYNRDDGAGTALSGGDYNGDGCDDILILAHGAYHEVAYLVLGNASRELPLMLSEADIIIRHSGPEIYADSHSVLRMYWGTNCKLADLNGDGLDDIILAYYRVHFDYIPDEILYPFIYVFFNRRPTPSLFHPDTNIIDNPHDSICIKLSFKQPLALHTLLLTVSGDTFTIDSPQVRFSPAESLLCFIPSTEWDTSTIIPFCIERLEDTIGTAIRERWCVRFNDSTWNVNQPPKPRTLSLTCYPNPFNAEVRIRLRMPDAGDIKIDIYDISGKLIDHIHKTKLTAGWHELVWRPSVGVPSGVYLLKVSTGGKAVVRRVVLVR